MPRRYFYARPCDEPALGWCVAEVEIGPKGAKWRSSLYERALARPLKLGDNVDLLRMTRAQARTEAKRWNEAEAKKARRK